MEGINIFTFAISVMQEARPLSEEDIHEVVEQTDGVHRHTPEIIERIKHDENAPEFLKKIVESGMVMDSLNESKSDPKIDPIDMDTARADFSKWLVRTMKPHGDEKTRMAMSALDIMLQWLSERKFDLYRLRCDNKNCEALHVVIPMRIPIGWVMFDGIAEKLFVDSKIDDNGLVMGVFDAEILLTGFVGLAWAVWSSNT